jgi:hypothetical protein
MKKIHYILLGLYLSSTILVAQNDPKSHHHYFCGHDIVLDYNELKHPGYKDVISKTFGLAKRAAAENPASRSFDSYKIKVVFHVVWRNPEENLHDSVIVNQLERLNEDFRRLNEDASNIRGVFEDRQADSRIEFELAEIKRVQTTATFTPLLITLPDNVKRSNQGGSSAVDPDRYLNIWVCKIQPIPFIGGQVFGYAYPPAGLSNWPAGSSAPSPELDGVVVDFRCIGANNPNPMQVPGFGVIPQNGRTMVHEVGHYLGLRHIWGDGGGIFGGDSCGADDGVEDTPNQGLSSNYNCDPEQNSCDTDDEPDMIENYMDYSDQACQNTFTEGQAAIMRAVLEGPRAGLIEEFTNTKEINDLTSIRVYPNPVNDKLVLSLMEDVNFDLLNVRMYAIQGNPVGALEINPLGSGTISIDVSHLPAGIYMLYLQGQTIKVIKR